MDDLISRSEVMRIAKDFTFTSAEDRRQYMDFLNYCLDNAPTVEAKPVVRGEWLDTCPEYHNGFNRNAYKCSNCGDYYTTEPEDLFFCPRCGADMRKKVE